MSLIWARLPDTALIYQNFSNDRNSPKKLTPGPKPLGKKQKYCHLKNR